MPNKIAERKRDLCLLLQIKGLEPAPLEEAAALIDQIIDAAKQQGWKDFGRAAQAVMVQKIRPIYAAPCEAAKVRFEPGEIPVAEFVGKHLAPGQGF
jgi:hypothetical protein